MTERYSYLRDPAAIYRRSAEIVTAETDLRHIPPTLHGLVHRLVHACGMPEIAADLAWYGDPFTSGRQALVQGAAILVDCRMVVDGIIRNRLPANNPVVCTLDDPRLAAMPRQVPTTRSGAAVDLWPEQMDNAVIAIGNAPTALFRLLELMQAADSTPRPAAPRPAAIFAFPVGFVGATESKQALIDADLGIPFMTLPDRRGGSAMAAAAVNALCGGLGQ